MFDKLDTVDWVKLGASHVRILLQRLRDSEDHDVYALACREIEDLIFPEELNSQQNWGVLKRVMQNDLPHQIAPFLIDILKSSEVLDKQALIVELLRELSTYKYHEPLVNLDTTNPKRIAFSKWASELNKVIIRGLPVYQKLLDDSPFYISSLAKELIDNLA